ncbi:hypothetical protein [Microvirga sp. P5_D2]
MSAQTKPHQDRLPGGAYVDQELLDDAQVEGSHKAGKGRKEEWAPRKPREVRKAEGDKLTWRDRDDPKRFELLQAWMDYAASKKNGLGIGPLRLAMFMYTRFNSDDGYCSTSKDTTAAILEVSQTRISEWRKDLIEAGLLIREKKSLKSVRFYPALPSARSTGNTGRSKDRIESDDRPEIPDVRLTGNTGRRSTGNTGHNQEKIKEKDQGLQVELSAKEAAADSPCTQSNPSKGFSIEEELPEHPFLDGDELIQWQLEQRKTYSNPGKGLPEDDVSQPKPEAKETINPYPDLDDNWDDLDPPPSREGDDL